MKLVSKVYDFLLIAQSGFSVLGGTLSILLKDAHDLYKSVPLTKPCRESDELWNDVYTKSSAARNPGESPKFDMYELARFKAEETRLRSQKHDDMTMGNGLGTSKRPTLDLDNNGIKNVRNYSTKSAKSSEKVKHVAKLKSEPVKMTSSSVPSSRLERLFHYGALAAGVGVGVATESLKQYAAGKKPESTRSLILSPANIERMLKKFSRMRGAALKIGQLMSFQDNSVLPAEIQQILLRVQNSAHYMPLAQLHQVISEQLGPDWRKKYFESFQDVPIALASIGQVHRAVTKELKPVVMKVQYPGVGDSIDSDLSNLALLLTLSRLLPAGLFLDKTIDNARLELKWECDYIRELSNMIKFKELLKDDDAFTVPGVLSNLSGEHILTMEEMQGVEIVKGDWDQETKNWIASNIMRLCLSEIAQFRFMQTDPNWANFLYNEKTKKIELLDFGASREFNSKFTENYIGVLRASIKKDREGVKHYSEKLGYLTGLETPQMTQAHIDSVLVLGEPFSPVDNGGKLFDFSNQTVTDRVRGNIGLMLNERLTPPPEETYSLHRKLSGVFLLCSRMNAQVNCEEIFRDVVGY